MKLILSLWFAISLYAQTFVTGQVASCIGSGGGPTTATCAFPSAVGASHTLIVATAPAGSAGDSTVTDTMGNTYTHIINQGGTANFKMEQYYAWTTSAGANTVQVVNAGGFLRAIVAEYDRIVVPDAVTSNASGGTSVALTSSFQANDLVILSGSLFVGSGSWVLVPPSGWNLRATTADGILVLYDQNLAPSGSYSVTGTATNAPTILGMSGMRLYTPPRVRPIVF